MNNSAFRRLLLDALKQNLDAGGVPRVPAGGTLLWRWFNDLSRQRSYHAAGPNPIALEAIAVYARLHRWPIEPRHVELITAMDEVFLEAFHSKRKATAGVKTLPPRSQHAMTGGMFDAMFG